MPHIRMFFDDVKGRTTMKVTVTVSSNLKLSVNIQSNYGEARLSGTTHPFAPIGTLVERLVTDIPDDGGVHGMVFFYKSTRPRPEGFGKTARLDNSTQMESSLILIWREHNKLIAKKFNDLVDRVSNAELERFNEFSKSETGLSVSDTAKKIVYADSPVDNPADPAWTYKTLPTNTILQYICKRIALEDLDERAKTQHPSYTELLAKNDELEKALKFEQDYLKDKTEVHAGEIAGMQAKLDRAIDFQRVIVDKLADTEAKLSEKEARLTQTLEQLAEKNAALKTATMANLKYRDQIQDMLPLLDRLEKFPKWLLSGDSIMFLHAMRALKASNKI